jgi:lysophospholipase L1-like esterase
MRNLVTGLAVTIVTILVGLAMLEIFVRVAYSDGSNFDIEMWRYAKDLKQVSAIPGVGHEHRPETSGTYMGVPVSISSQGLRDRDYSLEKPAGVVRVLMLGDSLTFGWGAPVDGTTAKALERLLNAGGGNRRYEVVNTGVGNTNTAMQTAYFIDKGQAFDPDVVILNYFINDAEETPVKKDNWLTDWSYAAVFLAGRLDILERTYFGKADWQQYYRDLYRSDAAGWTAAQRSFDALADFCAETDVELMVVNYPELHELDPYPFADITEEVRALAVERNLPFLDLLPAIRGEEPESLWVTPTDSHPNAKAAELFAQAIAAKLRESYPALF